jgi:hypothetical protein
VDKVTAHGRVVGGYLSAREFDHYERMKRREREAIQEQWRKSQFRHSREGGNPAIRKCWSRHGFPLSREWRIFENKCV